MLNKEISILGCGWYGFALAQQLVKKGYKVKGSTTTPEKLGYLRQSGINPYLIRFTEEDDCPDPVFFDCSVLIICIPPKRNTTEQHTFSSKIERISAAASQHKVADIIFISSTSVYGDNQGEINELTFPIPETDSGKVILSAELTLQNNSDFRTTIIRFGGLIGPGRDPGRFFAGKTAIPNGKAPVNLIHLSDCIGLTLSIIEQGAFGYTYNACSTDHPSRVDFYTAAAIKSGLDKPEFKEELLNWKRVHSIYIPQKINYDFKTSLLDYINL